MITLYHSLCGLQRAELFFFFLSADFSGRTIEETYIRFMVISPAERCASAAAATAAALQPVPAGL